MKDSIKKYFKENYKKIEEEIVNLTCEMVREKTINVISEKLPEFPFLKFRGEEYRVGNIVKRELEKYKIPYEEYSRMEGRPNIIGKIGKDESGKRLLMAAHMDVVPAGDGWDTDPFDPVIKDGFIYGRGVLDDKGPLASILVAGKILKEVLGDNALSGEFQIAALSDEEAEDPDGIDYGVKFLVEENLINATFSIIPDIGENMKRIDIAEKGRAVFKITAIGKQAHGSTPERGINAIYKMAHLINEIEKLKFKYEVSPTLGHPTLNLGEIHGGAAPNIVPGDCYIYIDIRSVPGMTKEYVFNTLKSLTQKVDGKFEVELLSWNEPHEISPDNDLVKAIQINGKDVLGFEPEPFGMGGGTFAKTLNLAGITSVGWGPGDDEAYHVANEYVEIKQLVDFSLMTCLIAIDLLT